MKKLMTILMMFIVFAYAGDGVNDFKTNLGAAFVPVNADRIHMLDVSAIGGTARGKEYIRVGTFFAYFTPENFKVDTLEADIVIADATALVIGKGTETIAVNSSDWDISVTGVASGLGNITSNGVVSAEQLTSTDDATITDDLSVGGLIIGANDTLDNSTSGIWDLSDAGLQAATFNFIDISQVVSADAIVANFTPDLTLVAGVSVFFIADSAVSGAATFELDGVSDAIREASDNSALEANDIKANMAVQLLFDGTNWQQISQSGN